MAFSFSAVKNDLIAALFLSVLWQECYGIRPYDWLWWHAVYTELERMEAETHRQA